MKLLYRGMYLTAVQIARLKWLKKRESQKTDWEGRE